MTRTGGRVDVLIGAKRVERLVPNVETTGVALDEDDMAQRDASGRLPAEYPGWLIDVPDTRTAESVSRPPLGNAVSYAAGPRIRDLPIRLEPSPEGMHSHDTQHLHAGASRLC